MILTGADGQLLYGTNGVARVRNWSLSIQRNAIDVTCLDTSDREYVAGIRNTTGSATIFYDTSESDDIALLNSILDNRLCSTDECQESVNFVLNKCNAPNGDGCFRCTCLITEVSPSVSVGEATAVNVTFQVTGAISGTF